MSGKIVGKNKNLAEMQDISSKPPLAKTAERMLKESTRDKSLIFHEEDKSTVSEGALKKVEEKFKEDVKKAGKKIAKRTRDEPESIIQSSVLLEKTKAQDSV